ncbi:MAG: RNA-binding protein [Bacteroidales bacterium]
MNLFLGNLNYKVQEEELHDLLEKYGEVTSVRMISDRMTGRSKGFGFAEMPNDDEAKSAIEALTDYELSGRRLIINEARPREEKPERRSRY